MANVKITGFFGVAPKISPELLPDTAGQIAKNCKLHSGDLIPYPRPVAVDNTGRTGVIKTFFALRDPNTNEKKWLSWTTDVDVVVAYNADTGEQRFYYTGDGAPKVSNYKLATSDSPPYPTQYYDLGLPIPEENLVLQPTAITFTPKSISSYARDASNVVTITTSTPHGLRTGNFITVSGFNYIQGTYSQSGTIITVTINNHGLSNGAQVVLDFVTGSAVDGTYIVSNATTNTFEVTSSVNQTTSGIVRWDIRNFNATNVECTVVNSTTFTYFSPGPAVATTSSLVGKVELGGLPQARSYVFTWYTPWKEESIASKPSSELFIKEGTTVIISNIPTSKPSGNNFVRGVRLYRTLASTSKSDYFLLSTLWFPIKIAKVKRLSSISTITTLYPHNFDIGDRFLIRGLDSSATSFNVAGTVKDIIDDYTFTFVQTGLGNVGETVVSNGFVYHDIAENPSIMPPRYWGYVVSGTYSQVGTTITVTIPNHGFVAGTKVYLKFTSGAGVNGVYLIDSVTPNSFTVTANSSVNTSGNVTVDGYIFIDDFNSRSLVDILATDNYDPPPKNLQGLTVIQDNIMCGFVGNTLYFSEPGVPHAWPASYAISFEHNIVGIAAVSGSALVLTESYPYLVSGSDPANGMSVSRIDANLPCVSKKSIVTMGYGAVYSTHDGLAVYSPTSGPAVITKLLYDKDTWQANINPKTIVAVYYGGKYFASHSNGSFIFEHEPKIGGFFVTTDYRFTAAWYDSIDGVVYFVDGVNGDIYKWDDPSQPAIRQKWKSKVITTNDMVNFGAARVIADYRPVSNEVPDIWDEDTDLWELDSSIWNTSSVDGVMFRLWANKRLEFETELFDSNVFRLPMGYLSDTFEVEVEGDVRIRAIHLAETPIGLKEV